ncbi:GAF and ANTAR domain-containing protein [Micromonospora sp. DR5-3]|uniref:GAF and ANTAR domain-containing protein n=1 Tax=unclassified Micromonospora TaxID=2617518 RepID=UPI001651FBC2|nr:MULTISPECIES: GAF and ANTAR domain-containing protein [unclassified Micromonospora]MCW3820531.1 GAF and ANTAR domain-containing protein [Micromonospora sp. DR5-3]
MVSPAADFPLASAYSQLLALLADSLHVDVFLDQVVKVAAEVISPAVACGLTMRRDGGAFTVAGSDDLAARADEIQYGADEGPCLDALRREQVVEVVDLREDRRWPRYREHALRLGIVSSLSLPMTIDRETVGALNLYATQPAAFTQTARRRALAFTDQATAALTVILRQADQSLLHQQLTDAMASRSIIDQALGVLMGQQRCTAKEAFALLRQASQHRNRKLRDVAAQIIKQISGEDPPPAPEFAAPSPQS